MFIIKIACIIVNKFIFVGIISRRLAKVANFRISDRSTNYQMSKNGGYPSKHVPLCEMFHKEKYLSLEEVIPIDKFANHYKMVF